jgi:hypothetical protein
VDSVEQVEQRQGRAATFRLAADDTVVDGRRSGLRQKFEALGAAAG